MDHEKLKFLSEVETLLEYATDVGHFCEDENCTTDTPKCHDMHARVALRKLRICLEPPHESYQMKRLVGDAERIFMERWQKENVRERCANHGYTMIEWILCPEDQQYPDRISHRDARVAASVIQWLGTSCGLGFLRTCEGQVEKARAKRSEWARFTNRNVEVRPEELEAAELLAAPMKGKYGHHDLVYGIVAAIRKAKTDAIKNALETAIGAA